MSKLVFGPSKIDDEDHLLRFFLALKNRTTESSAQPRAMTVIVIAKPPANKTTAPAA
jgi:hypothetical protein